MHEVADQADDPAALAKGLAHLGVDDQVEVALAVAGLDVGQAVPLFRQRLQGLGEQPQAVGAQRQLAGLGAERHPAGGDDVAEIEFFELFEVLFADQVAADVDLHPPAAVLELDEGGLAEIAAGHDPAGDGIALRTPFEGGGVLIGMGAVDFGRGVADRAIVGVGILSLGAQLGHFGTALQHQVVELFHRCFCLSCNGNRPRSPRGGGDGGLLAARERS